METVEFAGSAPLSPTLPPGMEEARKLAPQDEDRPPVVDPWQACLQPATHGVLVRSEQLRDLLHGIASVDLYAPRVQPLHLYRLTRSNSGRAVIERLLALMSHPLCQDSNDGGLYAS